MIEPAATGTHATTPVPGPRGLRGFAGLLVAFGLVLGALAAWKPRALLVAGAVLGLAWVANLLLDRSLPAATRRRGALLPALFLATGGAATALHATAAAVVVAGAFGVLGLTALVRASFAASVYAFWMDAALPVGWSISRALLALIWYLVVTPIGLLMRRFRRNPMEPRFDRDAPSYWTPRRQTAGRDRYFRQY